MSMLKHQINNTNNTERLIVCNIGHFSLHNLTMGGTIGDLSDPAKLLLLVSLLAKDRAISHNAKAFIKELVLRRDPRLQVLLDTFETKETSDGNFLEQLHDLIMEESIILFNELFADTSLEVGKTLSKNERDAKKLHNEKV